MSDPPSWYDSHVEEAAARFEALSAEDVNAWMVDLLPTAPGALVLDVGAGTGRDAAWLAERGMDVVAVEPSVAMLDFARWAHPSPAIRWLSDSLPGLPKVLRCGLTFDLILLSGAWMFVAPADRQRAFRKLVTLLKSGGRLFITLRMGPLSTEKGMYPVSPAEIEALARAHGALVERVVQGDDLQAREGLSWTSLVIRLPDDGTGALPLLRHVILNDDKSSTYKLALLRVLCRIADGSAGYARDTDDGFVAIPLGLAGLYWIRLFKPLLKAGLPQSAINLGYQRLGFVRAPFRALDDLSPLDLRVGANFSGDLAGALHSALRDACNTIATMPAHFMSYADGAPILPVSRAGRAPRSAVIRLDADYLAGFGELKVPLHLWRALQRFDAWIEPALTAEWSLLMKRYATRQGRVLDTDAMAAAMTWSDPRRDVSLARVQALRLMGTKPLHCVWSGRRLTAETLDIDHCFPWAAWPCGDLWNLMPAHRTVNQNQKRDRVPGARLLSESEDRIQTWWRRGYLATEGAVLGSRFMTEAEATLPMMVGSSSGLDDVFEAIGMQQIRLRADQGVGVWDGASAASTGV
jgi:SAM-dependent methyltransferase